MNDELPEFFGRVRPRRAPAELRARVLEAVDQQLSDQSCATAGLSSSVNGSPGATAGLPSSADPRSQKTASMTRKKSWERVLEWSVAASLLLGVGLNAWQWRADDAWQARVHGPSPLPAGIRDLAETIASVTDRQTAQTFVDQYLAARAVHRASEEAGMQRYEQWIQELTHPKKGSPL